MIVESRITAQDRTRELIELLRREVRRYDELTRLADHAGAAPKAS